MMQPDPSRLPVIVGVGQINDRPGPDEEGLDSIDLMAAAARAADRDAGGHLLSRCDWLAIVPQISFRELDPVALLPAALGIAPTHVRQAPMASGDTPILYLNEAANAVARGEAQVCLVAGGEALRTASRRKQTSGAGSGFFRAHLTAPELCIRYGVLNPAEIYALYENATRAGWGQSLVEGQAESGEIWSLMSKVAAESESAWIQSPKTPDEVVEPSADNRPIAFPYTKFMVANSSVNQGAAYIVTSLAIAREAGVPDESLVYVWAGAAAHDLEDPLARTSWNTPEVMRVSLERAMELNGLTAGDLDHVEPGDACERLADNVRAGADAERSHRDLTRIGFRVTDELLRRIHRQCRAHRQHERAARHFRDRREILDLVRQLLVQERIRRHRRHHGEHQRVAVIRRARRHLGADDRRGAAFVLDDDRHAQGVAHRLR